ncbi:MAG: hypothetical protein KC431_31320, partial [Myxococcales bacterium]|nr:hypothetical protein [Myxococcales bacterium]
MHQQMLARYNTERLSAGLELTEPLSDYGALIVDGYDSGLPNFAPRADNQHLTEAYRLWRDHESY